MSEYGTVAGQRAGSEMLIDISIVCTQWLKMAGIEQALSHAAKAAMRQGEAAKGADKELSLVLGSDALLSALNNRYRGKDEPTNVLSFPAGDDIAREGPPRLLGDVVLAYETICAQADMQGKSHLDHACHLTVHGVLHLLGFCHDNETATRRMERLEIDILASLGLPDPYSIIAGQRAGKPLQQT